MNPQLAAIAKAAEGLLLPSETDVPLVPFFWRRCEWESATADLSKAHRVKLSGVDEFFKPYVLAESWMNAEEIATRERLGVLQETIKRELPHARVRQWGGKIYICACVDGGVAGLKSEVVET